MLRYLSVGRQRARLIAGCVSLAGCVATERSLPIAPPPSNMVLSAAVPEYSAAVPEMAIDPRDPRRIAVIWRYLSMDGINQERQRHFECHLSLSSDGGRTFSQQRLEWDSPQTPVCNSPFVDIGSRGELMIGATLAGVLPQGVPPGTHADGKVGMRLSHDWGRSWTATQSLIASDHGDRFVPNPAVPIEATKVPWDGGRGMIDATTGAIVLTGGFPAPPGEQQHSQRFFTVSHDSGRQWGPIRAWTATGWPQRWDGTMITAHGKLAIAYLAAAVPIAGARCLCIVFATSGDDGKMFDRHLVAEVDGFDKLVHYPPLAAHPHQPDVYALAYVAAEGGSPVVRWTRDRGKTWRTGTPAAPDGVVRASRPAVSYAEDGTLVVLWRGYRADQAYDIYIAAADRNGRFGRSQRLSSAASREPEELLKDYSVRGDFISAVGAGGGYAHGAWTDWRSGRVGQIAYARVGLDLLRPVEAEK